MKGLHIMISEEQHQRLKTVAKYYGMSMKAYILTFINTKEVMELEKQIREKK